MKYVNSQLERALVQTCWSGDPDSISETDKDMYRFHRYSLSVMRDDEFHSHIAAAGVEYGDAVRWREEYQNHNDERCIDKDVYKRKHIEEGVSF